MNMTENTFASWDGTRLFYRAWLPGQKDGDHCKKALVLFHRGHEHSGRFSEFVADLGLKDVAVFAWDARGHGHSPGARGRAENLTAVIQHVDPFVRDVSAKHATPISDVSV